MNMSHTLNPPPSSLTQKTEKERKEGKDILTLSSHDFINRMTESARRGVKVRSFVCERMCVRGKERVRERVKVCYSVREKVCVREKVFERESACVCDKVCVCDGKCV